MSSSSGFESKTLLPLESTLVDTYNSFQNAVKKFGCEYYLIIILDEKRILMAVHTCCNSTNHDVDFIGIWVVGVKDGNKSCALSWNMLAGYQTPSYGCSLSSN